MNGLPNALSSFEHVNSNWKPASANVSDVGEPTRQLWRVHCCSLSLSYSDYIRTWYGRFYRWPYGASMTAVHLACPLDQPRTGNLLRTAAALPALGTLIREQAGCPTCLWVTDLAVRQRRGILSKLAL